GELSECSQFNWWKEDYASFLALYLFTHTISRMEEEMSKKYSIFALVAILALVLVSCGGAAPVENNMPADNSGEALESDEAADSGESILDRVLARGNLVCGARTDLLGFGYLDADGNNVGFDIDLCRAVAAVLFNDPNAVEFVPLSAADRGPA